MAAAVGTGPREGAEGGTPCCANPVGGGGEAGLLAKGAYCPPHGISVALAGAWAGRETHGGAAEEDHAEGLQDARDAHHPGEAEEEDHAKDVLQAGQVNPHEGAHPGSLRKERERGQAPTAPGGGQAQAGGKPTQTLGKEGRGGEELQREGVPTPDTPVPPPQGPLAGDRGRGGVPESASWKGEGA